MLGLAFLSTALLPGFAGDPIKNEVASPLMQPGYRTLIEKTFLPPDFDDSIWKELWKCWDEPQRARAEKASESERRKMAFERYGFTERPGDPDGMPLQYTSNGRHGWVMNCFTCHGGSVAGQVIPGAPNSRIALQTLIDDVRQTKLRMRKPLSHMDIGSMIIPLGDSIGTTNAVIFGIALASHRDKDLNIRPRLFPPPMLHHDCDAPPWWHMHRKKQIYIDGFAEKGHRVIMQFIQVQENGPGNFRKWEKDFAQIYDWIESQRPPKYPGPIDAQLAKIGEGIFTHNCAECHGTYGKDSHYPERMIGIKEIGTDRARFDSIVVKMRDDYRENWFNEYGKGKVISRPEGYVAPPLDGVWASPPYFHNGSVPTLWHVLNSRSRPAIWKRSDSGYDYTRVGLEIETPKEVPNGISKAEKRRYFDTAHFGKSAAGHTFPDALSDGEKQAVLEYLKTL